MQESLAQNLYHVAMAMVFLPSTFLTGLFGVNPGGIPGGGWRFGFSSVLHSVSCPDRGGVLLYGCIAVNGCNKSAFQTISAKNAEKFGAKSINHLPIRQYLSRR